jgi:hypothetical protein
MLQLGSDTALLEPAEEQDEDTVLCTAELAECTCPEFCERDHDTD